VQCGIRLALARAHRSRGDTSRADKEAGRVLNDALPYLASELAALQSIEEVAKYWEEGGRFDEAANVQRILLEKHPKAANPCNATRNFVNCSTDLAYDLLWNNEPEEAMKSLTVALARAERPIEDGGLDQCSEARWRAANLHLHILKIRASSADATNDQALDGAQDEVNGLILARTSCNDSRKNGDDPLATSWEPKNQPMRVPATPTPGSSTR
jgi:hypothetical protein